MKKNRFFVVRASIALILALSTGSFIASAQTPQPKYSPTERSGGPGVQIKVQDFTLIAPVPGQIPEFTPGQVIFVAEQIYTTAFSDRFVSEFGHAKSRSAQEAAIKKFAAPAVIEKFKAMNAATGGPISRPEDFRAMTDPKEALRIAVYKQPFVTFSDWGESPFGEPVTDWKGLCATYQDTMLAMLSRTTYSDEIKVEWMDALADVCSTGLDNHFSKVVELQDWPLWQWTTGRIARTPRREDGGVKGVNVMYTGSPAKALYLFLPKASMVALHPFNCKGNPTIPFIMAGFQVTKETTQLPLCTRLVRSDNGSGALKLGDEVRYSVEFENKSGVQFTFRYVLMNKANGSSQKVDENRPDVTFQLKEPGDFRLSVAGEFEGKPIDAAACVVDLTVEAPPPPPSVIQPPSPPTCTLDVVPLVIRNMDDQWRVRIQETNPDNMSYASKTTVAFAGSNQPTGYQLSQAMEFSGTRADFGQFQGVATFVHTLIGANGKVLNSCSGKLATQQPPTETTRHFCGPVGVYCWGPPVVGGAIYALTRGSKEAATKPAVAASCSGVGPNQAPVSGACTAH